MDYIDNLMESLAKIDYKKREKNWESFFETIHAQEATVEFSLDNLLDYAGPTTKPTLRKRKKRRNKIKKNTVDEKQDVSECESSATTSDVTIESDVTSEEDVLTLQAITEMATNTYSEKSRSLVVKYLKETTSSYTLDECLAVVKYMESTGTTFKGLIMEMLNVGENHITDTEEYHILKVSLADMFYALRKNVEFKVLDVYIHYLKWLWHKKNSKKERHRQRSTLSDLTNCHTFCTDC